MAEFLISLWTIAKWFFLEFVPQIARASLGVIGEFIDAIGILKLIIIATMGLIPIAIKLYKKYR